MVGISTYKMGCMVVAALAMPAAAIQMNRPVYNPASFEHGIAIYTGSPTKFGQAAEQTALQKEHNGTKSPVEMLEKWTWAQFISDPVIQNFLELRFADGQPTVKIDKMRGAHHSPHTEEVDTLDELLAMVNSAGADKNHRKKDRDCDYDRARIIKFVSDESYGKGNVYQNGPDGAAAYNKLKYGSPKWDQQKAEELSEKRMQPPPVDGVHSHLAYGKWRLGPIDPDYKASRDARTARLQDQKRIAQENADELRRKMKPTINIVKMLTQIRKKAEGNAEDGTWAPDSEVWADLTDDLQKILNTHVV